MCDNSVAHIDSKAVAGIASPSLGDEKEVPGSIVRRARMCCGCKSYERRCCCDQDRMLGQGSSPKQSCNLCSGRARQRTPRSTALRHKQQEGSEVLSATAAELRKNSGYLNRTSRHPAGRASFARPGLPRAPAGVSGRSGFRSAPTLQLACDIL
jgi:hypothetical protein